MPSWSALPMEMRGEIVKRLDFRTRFRFRHVSKSSQELVDSVPLYIPRVAIEVRSETEAKLTFYLGIKKRIDVTFVNAGGTKTSVKVTEISLTKIIPHGAIRHVDFSSAPMLALAVFRNVTTHANTLSGAVDFKCTDHIEFASSAAAHQFFDHRKFRTKLFCSTQFGSFAFMKHVVVSEVEEVRVMFLDKNQPHLGRNLFTTTKRVRIQIEEEELKKWKKSAPIGWYQTYVTPADVPGITEYTINVDDFRAVGLNVEKFGDDGYMTSEKSNFSFLRVNSCGVAHWRPPLNVKLEDPTACSMSWACAQHADPFDHWYNTRTPAPRWHSEMEHFERSYREHIFPVVNGHCPLTRMLEDWNLGPMKDYDFGKV